MTDTAARIEIFEGEFHYADLNFNNGECHVRRHDQPPSLCVQFFAWDVDEFDDEDLRADARTAVQTADRQARHFIAQGKTEERERINGLALEVTAEHGEFEVQDAEDGRVAIFLGGKLLGAGAAFTDALDAASTCPTCKGNGRLDMLEHCPDCRVGSNSDAAIQINPNESKSLESDAASEDGRQDASN